MVGDSNRHKPTKWLIIDYHGRLKGTYVGQASGLGGYGPHQLQVSFTPGTGRNHPAKVSLINHS